MALASPYYVSTDGDDTNPGSIERPFATLHRAQQAARQAPGNIVLRGGTYYLKEPLILTEEDSGTRKTQKVIQSYRDEIAILSGGTQLRDLDWQSSGNGLFQAKVPEDLQTEELFVNGQRQILARYPNVTPSAQYFDGYAPDAISPERASRWKDPTGGYFHAMHPSLWGDFTWRILGKDRNNQVRLEGGWQNNRGAGAHETIRYVENIFEELDAPGEWYLDRRTHTLYYFPPAGLDLVHARIEATRLRTLVELRGDERHPVRWVRMSGLTFRQAARSFMDNREPLLRSDWTIYRGGAICLNGTEDCSLEDCDIDQAGGNAVFVNNYNRRATIRGTHISQAGASGICFVGDPRAARSPTFNYNEVQELDGIDRTPGPKNDNYPADCLVDDCLIHQTGRVEKQTAGIEIDLAARITLRHCSIYDMPRAGINIGDGCWGGHRIEFCDVFDTVKETGDHGSFNSWGRDRFWRPGIEEVNAWIRQAPELPLLDAREPIMLVNNRWRCDHGWAIDLDDGSSNYIIRDNLCLRGGIKNREGFRRIVENNILVDGGYDPHVWYAGSGDIFRRNIVWTTYHPANMPPPPWGAEMDHNLVHSFSARGTVPVPATQLQAQSGRDGHSLVADARFIDTAIGDYRVKPDSPALALGFVNFPMDQFGVRKPALRALARVPELPQTNAPVPMVTARPEDPITWLGAQLRNIVDAGEQSAFGLPNATGVLILDLTTDSPLMLTGLRRHDVILALNDSDIPDTRSLLKQSSTVKPGQSVRIGFSRNQVKGEVVFTGLSDTPCPVESSGR
jgi:hypothetical protein